MWKRVVLVGFLALGSWTYYDYKRAGLDTRPEMPPGAFSLSFRNGLRAVVVNQTDLRPERDYATLEAKVPDWLSRAWSICEPATDAEKAQFPELEIGYRPEAICRIDVDGEIVVRGLLLSRPNL